MSRVGTGLVNAFGLKTNKQIEKATQAAVEKATQAAVENDPTRKEYLEKKKIQNDLNESKRAQEIIEKGYNLSQYQDKSKLTTNYVKSLIDYEKNKDTAAELTLVDIVQGTSWDFLMDLNKKCHLFIKNMAKTGGDDGDLTYQDDVAPAPAAAENTVKPVSDMTRIIDFLPKSISGGLTASYIQIADGNYTLSGGEEIISDPSHITEKGYEIYRTILLKDATEEVRVKLAPDHPRDYNGFEYVELNAENTLDKLDITDIKLGTLISKLEKTINDLSQSTKVGKLLVIRKDDEKILDAQFDVKNGQVFVSTKPIGSLTFISSIGENIGQQSRTLYNRAAAGLSNIVGSSVSPGVTSNISEVASDVQTKQNEDNLNNGYLSGIDRLELFSKFRVFVKSNDTFFGGRRRTKRNNKKNRKSRKNKKSKKQRKYSKFLKQFEY
jgi:hypothetical protein